MNQLEKIGRTEIVQDKRQSVAVTATQHRAVQEIQASLIVAMNNPRNQIRAFERSIEACKRKGLAEEAAYRYKRGDTEIYAPSIRLAEVLFQNWGNCVSKVEELERDMDHHISRVRTSAWDLETNFRDEKEFEVPHEVGLKGGGKKLLTDPRDIYEHVANIAARRKRACMLTVLPKDYIDEAMNQCERTLAKTDKEVPMIDRIRRMVTTFKKVGVTQKQIETWLEGTLETCTDAKLIELHQIYKTIADQISPASEFFGPAVVKPSPRDAGEPEGPTEPPPPDTLEL